MKMYATIKHFGFIIFGLIIFCLKVKADMNEIQDSVSYRMEELRSKVNTLIHCDIASSTK